MFASPMDFSWMDTISSKVSQLVFWLFQSYHIPLIAILGWVGYLSLKNFRYCWYAGVFFVPLSQTLDFESVSITVPSDFLAIFLMGVVFLRVPLWKSDFFKMAQHPILLSFFFYYLWMGITIFTSQIPIVSLKYFLNTSWYFWGFCAFSILLFREEKELDNWIRTLVLPLSIVILWTLFHHAQNGFSHQSAYRIMQPFYKEHTAYAASLTFFFFFFLYQLRTGGLKGGILFSPAFYMVILLTLALLFSYTRGSWVGILVASGMMLLLHLWKRWRQVILPIGGAITLFLLFNLSNEILYSLRQSSSSSESQQNLIERMRSIVNLSTDASNLERINRWIAAHNMIEDRPITGMGPGTFAMIYSGYQLSEFQTDISTNRGDQGTAHSEYFLVASEMGIPGLFFFFLFVLTSLYYSAKGYLNAKSLRSKFLYLFSFGNLVAYYTHGIVNNFLDQDKVAIPFYITIALTVALDTFHSDPNPKEPQKPSIA
jgi:O-antigen ligase